MSVLFSILLFSAASLAAVVSNLVFAFHESDAAGQGLTRAFAFLGAIVLWLLIGGLLAICGVRGGLPGFTWVVVLILYVPAVAGYFAAVSTLDQLASGQRFESLLRGVTVALPYLAILFSAWNFFPALRALLPVRTTGLAAGLLSIALSAVPWLVMAPAHRVIAARQEALLESWDRLQQLIKEVDSMPADTPLAGFLYFAYEAPDKLGYVHSAAIGRMRRLPQRQEEVEELLGNRDFRILGDLGSLELHMTPGLCQGGRSCARIVAEKAKPSDAAPDFDSAEALITPYVVGIRWLQDNGCDCKDEVAAIEQTFRLYPFSYPRKWFIDGLLEMQGKPREP
jgi:hypothetical protein